MKNPSLSMAEVLASGGGSHVASHPGFVTAGQQPFYGLPPGPNGGASFILPAGGSATTKLPEAAANGYASDSKQQFLGDAAPPASSLSNLSSGLEGLTGGYPLSYFSQQQPALHGSFTSLVGSSQQQHLSYAPYAPIVSSAVFGGLHSGRTSVNAFAAPVSSASPAVSLPPPVRQESRPLAAAGSIPLQGGETNSLRQPIMSSTAQPSLMMGGYQPPGGLIPFMMMSGNHNQGLYHPYAQHQPLSAQQRYFLQQQQQQQLGGQLMGGVPGSPVSPPPLLDHHRLSPSNLVTGGNGGGGAVPPHLQQHHQPSALALHHQQQQALAHQQQQQQALYNHYNTFSGYPAVMNHSPAGLAGLQSMLGQHPHQMAAGLGHQYPPAVMNVGGIPTAGVSTGGLVGLSPHGGGPALATTHHIMANGGPGVVASMTGSFHEEVNNAVGQDADKSKQQP